MAKERTKTKKAGSQGGKLTQDKNIEKESFALM